MKGAVYFSNFYSKSGNMAVKYHFVSIKFIFNCCLFIKGLQLKKNLHIFAKKTTPNCFVYTYTIPCIRWYPWTRLETNFLAVLAVNFRIWSIVRVVFPYGGKLRERRYAFAFWMNSGESLPSCGAVSWADCVPRVMDRPVRVNGCRHFSSPVSSRNRKVRNR